MALIYLGWMAKIAILCVLLKLQLMHDKLLPLSLMLPQIEAPYKLLMQFLVHTISILILSLLLQFYYFSSSIPLVFHFSFLIHFSSSLVFFLYSAFYSAYSTSISISTHSFLPKAVVPLITCKTNTLQDVSIDYLYINNWCHQAKNPYWNWGVS